MKLKVLICAFICVPEDEKGNSGGEAVLGWNVIKQISRFHKVSVITRLEDREDLEKSLEKKQINNVKFYYIGFPSWLEGLQKFHGGIQIYAYLWQIKAYFVAKKLHKENNFDVFHHVTFANDWMASFIGALLPVLYIRGPCGGAQKVPESFLKEFSFKAKIKEKFRSIGQWVFRHDPFFIIGQNKAKAILVCNKESFNALPEKWQKKAFFFPVNGINKEDFKNLVHKKNQKKIFSVIMAGRLVKIKAYDLAIKVFKNFSDKFSDAEFTIIGDGPELEKLKGITSNLNLKSKIFFEKWMPREKLFQEMAFCDVFLFSSLRDGGGNVVVEAMAAGTPVVCFDLAGPGLHIDEKCGIKIKAENPDQAIDDMARALGRLYLDKDLRLKLGTGAKEKAEKEYDWDKLGDKLNEIYIATLNYKKH